MKTGTRMGALAAAVGLAVASAMAEVNRTAYLSLQGGYNTTGDAQGDGESFMDFGFEMDDGWHGSAGAGAYLEPFRLEFQYTHQENDATLVLLPNEAYLIRENGEFVADLFMLNAYWDIPVAKRTSVYLGGGAGLLLLQVNNQSTYLTVPMRDAEGTGLAYQVMAGLAYDVTDHLTLTAGYRGWSATEIDVDPEELTLPWSHMLEAGLRLSF